MSLLAGLRVVETAGEIAGPYAAKLLADLGADVVKVECPEGDPARHVAPFVDDQPGQDRGILFLHLNTSKRGVRLDTAKPSGVEVLRRLVEWCDVLITEEAPCDDLLRDPRVVLRLTPFGGEGPWKDYKATPFTTFHSAGEGYLTPVASHLMPEVVDRPPLRQGRFASEYELATYAATLVLAAVFRARATGQGQLVDLSKQDALLGLNFLEFQGYLNFGATPSRASLAVPFGGITRCGDGYLQFTFHEEHQWRALVDAMGAPDWAQAEWAATEESRLAHADEINEHLAAWLSTRSREEVVRASQEMGVTVAPYLSVGEVASSAQTAERGYLAELAHPVAGTAHYPVGPWRFSGAGPTPKPAPTLGQHTREVLGSELAISAEELDQLAASGTI